LGANKNQSVTTPFLKNATNARIILWSNIYHNDIINQTCYYQ
jgi:hypothetical protein